MDEKTDSKIISLVALFASITLPTIVIGVIGLLFQIFFYGPGTLHLFELAWIFTGPISGVVGLFVGAYIGAHSPGVLRSLYIAVTSLVLLTVFVMYMDFNIGNMLCSPPYFKGTMDCTPPSYFATPFLPSLLGILIGWLALGIKHKFFMQSHDSKQK